MNENLIHPTLKHPLTGCPLQAVGVVKGRPVWPIMGGSGPAGGEPPKGDAGKDGKGAGDGGKGDGEKLFTQAELEAKITERLNRERDQTRQKYADYDELKKKAEQGKTVEEQLTSMQDELAKTRRENLKRTIQARYGLSDEDADLYLVGDDQETLERQAKGLKELRDSKTGAFSPREGRNGRPTVTDEKQAVRTLFGSGG